MARPGPHLDMSETPETCESDTPETDYLFYGEKLRATMPDYWEFTRKLERERNKLHRNCEILMVSNNELFQENKVLRTELCSVQAAFEGSQDSLECIKRERDEARNIARWLYQHGMATLKEGAHRRPWVREVIQ